MVPDPHCPSCNSTFVEEIPPENTDSSSNPELDPRNFQVDQDPHHDHGPAGFGDFFGPGTQGPDPIIALMNMLMARPLVQPPGRTSGTRIGGMGGGYGTTLRFDMSNGQGRVIFQSGGGGSPLGGIVPGPTVGSPGTRSRSPHGGPRVEPTGLEGLFALLSGMPMTGGPGGQMGDYVLDQQTLDEIVTRLMEQNQGARPVPAPDEMINKLPRTKIVPGHPLTEKECAVCKDTFVPPGPGEEDVVAVTLPCSDNPKFQHSFHEDCIIPWLKQNGTCPVCRYQLIPQPEPHGPPPQPPSSNGGNSNAGPGNSGGSNGGRSIDDQSGSTAGSSIVHGLGGLWDLITGGHGHNGGSPSTSNTTGRPPPSEERDSEERRRWRERERREQDTERNRGSFGTRSPPPTRYPTAFPDRYRSNSSEGPVGSRSPRPNHMSRHQSSNGDHSPPGAWEDLD